VEGGRWKDGGHSDNAVKQQPSYYVRTRSEVTIQDTPHDVRTVRTATER